MSGGRKWSPFRQILGETWGPWRLDAACRDADPDLFFPIGTTGPAVELVEAAKAICARCPVRGECLEAHLREPEGVFGGLDEMERRRLARQRAAS